jgi:hypothetical protein
MTNSEVEEYQRLEQWADSLNERDTHNQQIIKRCEARISGVGEGINHEAEVSALVRYKRIAADIAAQKKSFPVKRFQQLAKEMHNEP